jgi:hypothetical protein
MRFFPLSLREWMNIRARPSAILPLKIELGMFFISSRRSFVLSLTEWPDKRLCHAMFFGE